MNNILGSGYNKLTGEFRCIKKYYDRNIIYGYDLIDVNGKITFAHSSALKEALSTNAVSIDNIKLTSDGRILANVPEDREKFNKVVGNRGAKPSTTKVSRGPSKGCMIVNSFNICDNTIVINNQRVDRNDVIRKAVQTKTGILGLSVCADINCCFNTNDYFEMYTKLSKVFIKIHRELWRNCVSNSITDKIVDYHKSFIGMRNNKMFYLCDFLDIYGGEEPIFLSISPIIDNEGKYKFECNYYCNEFDIHEVHSNIDSIVNYYKGLQRKYK